MKIKNEKRISMVMAGLGSLTLLSGCGSKESAKQDFSVDQVNFPVKEDVTLKIWARNTHTVVKNYSEMGVYKKLQELTGIKVDFIHPVANQAAEQFNIMIASREFPDIIETVNDFYKGGLVKAYEDEVIYDLTELMPKYAPNLNKFYEAYPQLLMESKDTSGGIFAVPMIRGGNIVRTYRGPILRADYLKRYGLSVPETIDEWHNVLTAFKANGVAIPFTSTSSFFKTETFIGAFGLNFSFFADNGTIKYGPFDDKYKDFLALMAKWYQEGLIDSEITTNDQKIFDSKVMNAGAGAFIGTTGNSVGGFISEMAKKNPQFDLVAAPYPVLNKGDKPYIIQRDPIVQLGAGSSITKTSEHPEYAMAFLDYGFTKEGHMLYNFGVEGESYNMVDGYPKYTEAVTNNPDGLPLSKAGSLYARAFTLGPFVQDPKYGEQFYGQQRQRESIETWTKYLDEYSARKPVARGNLTPLEAEEISPILNEINTYTGEMFIKFVMGQEDVETGFAAYQEQLKKLGIEKCIKYYQKAHDDYYKAFPELKNAQEIEAAEYFWN